MAASVLCESSAASHSGAWIFQAALLSSQSAETHCTCARSPEAARANHQEHLWLQVYFPASALSERGSGGALSHIPADHPIENPFSSIPATFWFMIVTLMTVGYGDMVPTTVTGRLVAVASMILSMLVLALPMSVVGTNFAQVRPDLPIVAHWHCKAWIGLLLA